MNKVIQLEEKEVVLNFDDFCNIDVQNVLTINYADLIGEVGKFPFVLNQIGFLFNESENMLKVSNFELKVLEDNLTELKGRLHFSIREIVKGRGINSPTANDIESEMNQDENIKALKKQIQDKKMSIIGLEKNKNDLQNLYWSCKAKSDILISLAPKVNF